MFSQNGEGVEVADIVMGEKRKGTLTFDVDDDSDPSPVSLPPGAMFDPTPVSLTSKEQERDVHFLSGRGGSGKSYYSATLVAKYRAKGKNVFVITDIPDKKFGKCKYLDINDLVTVGGKYADQLRVYRKKMMSFKRLKKDLEPEEADELELALMDIKPKDSEKRRMELVFSEDETAELFKNSVVLFDDYEKNENISLISFLRDHLLTKSRHYKCSLIICNHSTNFGRDSKLIMGETSNFVLFKKSTPHSRKYFMSEHLAWKPREIDMVENALKTSRWVNIDRDLDICLSQQKAWRV